MQIVVQSASNFYSRFPFPSQALLSAPPPRLMLSAPRIAGLLVAPVIVPARVEIVLPPTPDEIWQQIGPIQTRDEMNAEIAEMTREVLQSLRDLRTAKGRRQ